MEINENSAAFLASMRDFRRARQRALLERIAASLSGKSADLLSYDEVRQKLRAGESVPKGLQQIPLAAIVGSVGRYTDFTRSFLPVQESDQHHWAEVKTAIANQGDIPPIIVFQIDQAYFVLDGNHRVSVARQLGLTHIPAYVTEIQTDVPFSPDVQPDELITKARYADFLEKTDLHRQRPEADLTVTAPGAYRDLEEQLEIHHRWLCRDEACDIPYPQAVVHWYDEVYLPIIDIIRKRGILRYFPGRTETDLYVWIFRHQQELKSALGWEVEAGLVARDLVEKFGARPGQWLARLKEKLLHRVMPKPLDAGPPPGQWRREQLPGHDPERLFADVLVPVATEDTDWVALKQATVIAWREESHLHGLHVVPTESNKDNRSVQHMQAEFKQRCKNSGVTGEMILEAGRPIPVICDRARWTDLVVIYLANLPRPQPGDRLRSGYGALVRGCPRPVLAVPAQHSPLKRTLLAYDGSPKAREALFVAAYLAARWEIPLTVVSVTENGRVNRDTLDGARRYLRGRRVEAQFVPEQGAIAEAIIRTARQHHCDFIVMGGYGYNPLLEVVLGSEVDQILRARQWPVLICR